MTEPRPVACRVFTHPVVAPADPEQLAPLLSRMADAAPVRGTETYPIGTLQPDGRLDLCKQGLGAAGALRVLDRAVGSPHAVHLLLGTNDLRAEGTRALADALTGEHHVQTLYLGCNAIDAAAAAPLAVQLAEDSTVRSLWLKRNPLGDDGVSAVAAMLRRNTSIQTLDLVNTGMTIAGLRILADALTARARPVERIYLGGNGLGPDSAPVLAALLRDAGVRELYLSANHLGDAAARALAQAACPGAVLGLGSNGLTPGAVSALAPALSVLDALDLGRPLSSIVLGTPDNLVGDEGAFALAAALPGSSVRRLDLRRTGIRGRGAKALLAAVEAGTALTRLTLGSGVPRRIKRAIADALPLDPPAVTHIASVYR